MSIDPITGKDEGGDVFEGLGITPPAGPGRIVDPRTLKPAEAGGGVLDAHGQNAMDRAKAMQRKLNKLAGKQFARTMVEAEMVKGDAGDVLLVWKCYGILGDNTVKLLLEFGHSLDAMIDLVRQMIQYSRENLPDWAKAYYAAREFCPHCRKVLFYALTVTAPWEVQDAASYRDDSAVECVCGWKGTIHQLLQ